MLSQLFAANIAEEFEHSLTRLQAEAALKIGEFLTDPRSEQAFILKGYAGTGKTTLVAAMVRVWRKLHRPVVLLAPTGRAAKVLSQHAGYDAYTIHKYIYRQQSFAGEETLFNKGWNKHREALFVVDEASMISNFGGNRLFGTGQLLDDLIEYVYAGMGCRLMFVGDTAQLPPIGETESPALQVRRLENLGLHVRSVELTEVVRQQNMSLVLRNATHLRQYIKDLHPPTTSNSLSLVQDTASTPNATADNTDTAPNEKAYLRYITTEGLPIVLQHPRREVRIVRGDELIDQLEASYRNWGVDETIIVTKSNKRAILYNNGVRNRILEREELLSRGDMVMVVKNNYFWTAQQAQHLSQGESLPLSFIANGETAEIVSLRNIHKMHGFDFADALLRFADYGDYEIECRVLLNTLQSESAALTTEEAQQLFLSVQEDYLHITQQRERMRAIRQDAYYNALQIKYAYAITCHKAQGGQWQEVYVDQGFLPEDADFIAHLRWLYTAFTRTSGNLYLVNWPEEQYQTYSQAKR